MAGMWGHKNAALTHEDGGLEGRPPARQGTELRRTRSKTAIIEGGLYRTRLLMIHSRGGASVHLAQKSGGTPLLPAPGLGKRRDAASTLTNGTSQ